MVHAKNNSFVFVNNTLRKIKCFSHLGMTNTTFNLEVSYQTSVACLLTWFSLHLSKTSPTAGY